MYLTFEEYQNYGGKLDPEVFDRLEYRAERKLKNLTYSRIDGMAVIPEAVKRLMFELISITNNADAMSVGSDGAIASFSNDGYSESYGTAKDTAYFDSLVEDTCRDYLLEERDDHGVPLMFCGVDP